MFPKASQRKKFESHCSTDSAGLFVQIEKKNFFGLDLEVSVGDVTMGHVFAPFWLRLPGPVRQSNKPFFLTQAFLIFYIGQFSQIEVRKYENLFAVRSHD